MTRSHALCHCRRSATAAGFFPPRLFVLLLALVAPAFLAFGLASPLRAQTLQEVLAQTYVNNPTLATARAQLRVVDENVPQALAGWRPTVSITGSYSLAQAVGRLAARDLNLPVALYDQESYYRAVRDR